MFRNYLKIAFRNLIKDKLHSSINILGLAIGFVVAILSYIYIQHELSYETWIPENDRIYRVFRQSSNSDGGWTYTPKNLAPILATEVVGVEKATSVYEEWRILLTKDNQSLYVKDVANIDSSFFDVFQFSFLYGNPKTAMDLDNSIVISERLSKLFFGEANPVGELIKGDGEQDYIITGVLSGDNGDSYLQYEVYTPFYQTWFDHWLANNVTTYILKSPTADIQMIAERTDQVLFPIYKREMNAANMKIETIADLSKWKYQPFSQIHLFSEDFSGVRAASGNILKLYLYGIIAFIVLLIACINYLNLATAKAATRAMEVGMRKVSGANLVFTEFLLPSFNRIVDRNLTFFQGNFSSMFLPLIGIGLLIGLLAGIYPAFFLSNFKPVKTLKGKTLKTTGAGIFRKGLVVTQFSITVVLIIMMTFIVKQLDYMQSQDLGFKGEKVITVEINRWDTPTKIMRQQNELLSINGVESMTLSNNVPGYKNSNYTIHMEGVTGNQNPDMLFVTPAFEETMGLEMLEGRFFSYDFTIDTTKAFVVNETFVKEYIEGNPIGKRFNFVGENDFGPIIGVVKDHHFRSLADEIRPLAMSARQDKHAYNYASFKLSQENMPTTINALKEAWKNLEPTHPIQYSFLDEKFQKQYEENERFGQTVLYTTLLAIFIAILGLFGLTSFMAEQRSKEIGVRKILGASTVSLINLLIKDFVKLVLIAGLIAIPFGYWLVKNWLQDFAYATQISVGPFIFAIFLAILLAIFTVSYQSIKISSANPAKALKTE